MLPFPGATICHSIYYLWSAEEWPRKASCPNSKITDGVTGQQAPWCDDIRVATLESFPGHGRGGRRVAGSGHQRRVASALLSGPAPPLLLATSSTRIPLLVSNFCFTNKNGGKGRMFPTCTAALGLRGDWGRVIPGMAMRLGLVGIRCRLFASSGRHCAGSGRKAGWEQQAGGPSLCTAGTLPSRQLSLGSRKGSAVTSLEENCEAGSCMQC